MMFCPAAHRGSLTLNPFRTSPGPVYLGVLVLRLISTESATEEDMGEGKEGGHSKKDAVTFVSPPDQGGKKQ